MKYTMVRLFLIAASCCVVSFAANPASAGFGLLHGGGSSGGASYGSYGSSGGYAAGYGSSGGSSGYAAYSYGSSGGSSGGVAYGSSGTAHGPGPLRRFAAHIHDHIAAKHARRAAYASSGGSSGYASSYGSSGGSSGSYVSSYGSSGGYGSSGYSTSYGSSGTSVSYGSSGGYSTSYGSTGSSYYGSTGSSAYSSDYIGVSNQAPASASSFASYSASSESDAIFLNVDVPASAKIFVNDMPTTSTGTSRQYVSRGLVAGKSYKFELRAELVDANGQVAKETKLVTLTAGQKESVRFVSLEGKPVQTAVTLNVPADAKVILAGNETKASGETRTFRTSQLKAGEQWDDYVVEVHHAGKVKRESLRLIAGDEVSLTFNFDDDQALVASR